MDPRMMKRGSCTLLTVTSAMKYTSIACMRQVPSTHTFSSLSTRPAPPKVLTTLLPSQTASSLHIEKAHPHSSSNLLHTLTYRQPQQKQEVQRHHFVYLVQRICKQLPCSRQWQQQTQQHCMLPMGLLMPQHVVPTMYTTLQTLWKSARRRKGHTKRHQLLLQQQGMHTKQQCLSIQRHEELEETKRGSVLHSSGSVPAPTSRGRDITYSETLLPTIATAYTGELPTNIPQKLLHSALYKPVEVLLLLRSSWRGVANVSYMQSRDYSAAAAAATKRKSSKSSSKTSQERTSGKKKKMIEKERAIKNPFKYEAKRDGIELVRKGTIFAPEQVKDGHHLAVLLVTVQKFGFATDRTLLFRYAEKAHALSSLLYPKAAALILNVFARQQLLHLPLLESLSSRLAPRLLRHANAQDLALLMHAFAAFGWLDPSFFAAITEEIPHKLPFFEPQHLVAVAQALAKVACCTSNHSMRSLTDSPSTSSNLSGCLPYGTQGEKEELSEGKKGRVINRRIGQQAFIKGQHALLLDDIAEETLRKLNVFDARATALIAAALGSTFAAIEQHCKHITVNTPTIRSSTMPTLAATPPQSTGISGGHHQCGMLSRSPALAEELPTPAALDLRYRHGAPTFLALERGDAQSQSLLQEAHDRSATSVSATLINTTTCNEDSSIVMPVVADTSTATAGAGPADANAAAAATSYGTAGNAAEPPRFIRDSRSHEYERRCMRPLFWDRLLDHAYSLRQEMDISDLIKVLTGAANAHAQQHVALAFYISSKAVEHFDTLPLPLVSQLFNACAKYGYYDIRLFEALTRRFTAILLAQQNKIQQRIYNRISGVYITRENVDIPDVACIGQLLHACGRLRYRDPLLVNILAFTLYLYASAAVNVYAAVAAAASPPSFLSDATANTTLAACRVPSSSGTSLVRSNDDGATSSAGSFHPVAPDTSTTEHPVTEHRHLQQQGLFNTVHQHKRLGSISFLENTRKEQHMVTPQTLAVTLRALYRLRWGSACQALQEPLWMANNGIKGISCSSNPNSSSSSEESSSSRKNETDNSVCLNGRTTVPFSLKQRQLLSQKQLVPLLARLVLQQLPHFTPQGLCESADALSGLYALREECKGAQQQEEIAKGVKSNGRWQQQQQKIEKEELPQRNRRQQGHQQKPQGIGAGHQHTVAAREPTVPQIENKRVEELHFVDEDILFYRLSEQLTRLWPLLSLEGIYCIIRAYGRRGTKGCIPLLHKSIDRVRHTVHTMKDIYDCFKAKHAVAAAFHQVFREEGVLQGLQLPLPFHVQQQQRNFPQQRCNPLLLKDKWRQPRQGDAHANEGDQQRNKEGSNEYSTTRDHSLQQEIGKASAEKTWENTSRSPNHDGSQCLLKNRETSVVAHPPEKSDITAFPKQSTTEENEVAIYRRIVSLLTALDRRIVALSRSSTDAVFSNRAPSTAPSSIREKSVANIPTRASSTGTVLCDTRNGLLSTCSYSDIVCDVDKEYPQENTAYRALDAPPAEYAGLEAAAKKTAAAAAEDEALAELLFSERHTRCDDPPEMNVSVENPDAVEDHKVEREKASRFVLRRHTTAQVPFNVVTRHSQVDDAEVDEETQHQVTARSTGKQHSHYQQSTRKHQPPHHVVQIRGEEKHGLEQRELQQLSQPLPNRKIMETSLHPSLAEQTGSTTSSAYQRKASGVQNSWPIGSGRRNRTKATATEVLGDSLDTLMTGWGQPAAFASRVGNTKATTADQEDNSSTQQCSTPKRCETELYTENDESNSDWAGERSSKRCHTVSARPGSSVHSDSANNTFRGKDINAPPVTDSATVLHKGSRMGSLENDCSSCHRSPQQLQLIEDMKKQERLTAHYTADVTQHSEHPTPCVSRSAAKSTAKQKCASYQSDTYTPRAATERRTTNHNGRILIAASENHEIDHRRVYTPSPTRDTAIAPLVEEHSGRGGPTEIPLQEKQHKDYGKRTIAPDLATHANTKEENISDTTDRVDGTGLIVRNRQLRAKADAEGGYETGYVDMTPVLEAVAPAVVYRKESSIDSAATVAGPPRWMRGTSTDGSSNSSFIDDVSHVSSTDSTNIPPYNYSTSNIDTFTRELLATRGTNCMPRSPVDKISRETPFFSAATGGRKSKRRK